jgi:hypothetical protein
VTSSGSSTLVEHCTITEARRKAHYLSSEIVEERMVELLPPERVKIDFLGKDVDIEEARTNSSFLLHISLSTYINFAQAEFVPRRWH